MAVRRARPCSSPDSRWGWAKNTARLTALQAQILEGMRLHPGLSSQQLLHRLGLRRTGYALRALKALQEAGRAGWRRGAKGAQCWYPEEERKE